MKRILTFSLCLTFLLVSCTSGYTSTYDTNSLSLDSGDIPSSTPTIKKTNTPVATETSEIDLSDPNNLEQLFRQEFESAVNGKGYDKSIYVIHKYFDKLEYIIVEDELYLVQKEKLTVGDFRGLAEESLYLATLRIPVKTATDSD